MVYKERRKKYQKNGRYPNYYELSKTQFSQKYQQFNHNNRIISKLVESMSRWSLLYVINHNLFTADQSSHKAATRHTHQAMRRRYLFLPGRPAQTKASCLKGKSGDRFAKHWCFCLRRPAASKPCAKSGRGGKMYASVCVCRANEVSGRLIRNDGEHNDLISPSNNWYVTYLNYDTYLMIRSDFLIYAKVSTTHPTRVLKPRSALWSS